MFNDEQKNQEQQKEMNDKMNESKQDKNG